MISERQNGALGLEIREAHDGPTLDLAAVRARVDEVLNRLGARLIGRLSDIDPAAGIDAKGLDPVTATLQTRVARFGQIAAGLAVIDAECLPARGAGFGSIVTVENVATGEREEYMLMVGSLVDIDANQVSLASPIGQALLGRAEGDEIEISTPHRQVRACVTRVITLMHLLADNEDLV